MPPRCVLVVESDAQLLQRLVVVLCDAGYRVEGATEGSEAMAVLRLRADTFDVVVADDGLAEGRGELVLRYARTLHPGLAVLLTTSPRPARRPRTGPRLAKPYSDEEFLRTVRGLAAERVA